MTLFKPGLSPPQVTMAALVLAGSKKIFSRGPAFSKSCPPLFAVVSISSGRRTKVLSVTNVSSTAERVSRGNGDCTSHAPRFEMAIVSGWLMSFYLSAETGRKDLVVLGDF